MGRAAMQERHGDFVNDTPLHSTKRELHALMSSRGVWISLVATGVILGLAGPFNTDEVLTTAPRLIYWLVVAAIGFLLGSAVATLTSTMAEAVRIPKWPALILAGTMAGVANLTALMGVNWLTFGIAPLDPNYLRVLGPNVIVISIIITAAIVAMKDRMAPPEAVQAQSAPTPPRILDRLPLDKRGALIALSVQDHYVQVMTDKGSTLILMRLSDAMAEVGDTPGLQVHRSHWVATGAVTAARRDGARAILSLANDMDIPVSRTYLPAVREAGLLPR